MLRRLHGVWGLGQRARSPDRSAAEPARALLRALLGDPENRVRDAAVKALGDVRDQASVVRFMALLRDKNAPVRMHAALALSRLRPTIGTIGEDEVFGERSALTGNLHSASATAETPCKLLKLDEDLLYELMADHPEVSRGLIEVLLKRFL